MTVHVVVGPPCAGKSSFVANSAADGVPRFDFDLVAATIGGTVTEHDVPADVRETVLAMRRGLMGWLLDAETEVGELWLINHRPAQDTIDRLTAIGAQFHLVDPGMAECLARAERDGRGQSTVEAIKRWYEAPPTLPEQKGVGGVKFKDMTFQVKADDDSGEGEFTAYAAVFDNIDAYGDVIRKGAFAGTLAEWSESGNTIPVLYGHDFRDPFANIGAVVDASEDERGLKITAKLDMDNEKAAQVYRLVKQKRLSQMSFAFDVVEGAPAEVDGEHVYELRSLKLYEVSVVPIGANQETEILAVKAAAESNRPEVVDALDRLTEAVKGHGPDKDHGGGEQESTPDEGGAARAVLAKLSILEKEQG